MLPVWALGPGTLVALLAIIVCAARSAVIRVRLRWGLRLCVVLLCVGALMRPTIPGEPIEAKTTEADVFLVVDTTSSILAEDWAEGEPRLNGIKSDIAALVNQLAGARFALVTFDQVATLDVPLTTDAAAVLSAVDVFRPEPSEKAVGSSIGIAQGVLADRLRIAASQSPERARAVFYFGDGEQTVTSEPESFADSASYITGGAVYGYGSTAGGPMKNVYARGSWEPAYIVDASTGSPAISRANPNNLTRVAEQLGVPFEIRSPAAVADAGFISASVMSADGFTPSTKEEELYWVPLIALFVLLLPDLVVLVLALGGSARLARKP
ncbi:MAG: VWA domain-containing protein [Mycetocola sp.]